MSRLALIVISLAALAACQTAPVDAGREGTEAPGRMPSPARKTVPGRSAPAPLDLTLLQRQLGMDRNIRELGLEEKSFDPCAQGIATGPDCARQFLSVINFRLQCRDSEGTDETLTSADIRAIRSDDVRWMLGKIEGQSKTDFEGYGQAIALSSKSQKRERFRISVKGRFLIITAEHVSRVVAPGPWCRDQ